MRGIFGALATPAPSDANKRPGPADDFWYEGVGAENAAGIRITPDIAIKASAVFACVKIIAESIASMPLQVFKLTSNGHEPAPNHPLDELIRFQPNVRQTAIEFWEMQLLHAALRGTAYAEIVPGPRGAVDQLIPLHPDKVRPELLPDQTLRFEVSANGQRRILLQDDVFRIPGISSDGIQGLRAVDVAAEAIGLGMAADRYAGRVFSNKLNFGGFLTHPKALSEEGQRNLIQALMLRFAGSTNSHRPVILQEGMKFEKASMDAQEAQLLEARKWQVAEIARFWRIPMHMLNVFDGVTRSNVEQQAFDFVKYTLRPWAARIEQAIRRDLILARAQYGAFYNFDDLMRGDSAARGQYYAQALGSGGHAPWMTVNEVRVREGLNRIDGGDVLIQPANQQTRPAGPPAAGQIEDRSPKGVAQKLIALECAAIRRAGQRFAGDADAFRTWAKAFYGGHVSTVTRLLGVPQSAARAYCAFQRDELIGANDIEVLLERRQNNGPDEIAQALTKWKDGA